MPPVTPLLDRILRRVEVGDCWTWLGAKTGAGYGAIGAGRRTGGTVYVHRATYLLLVGPIPTGLELDHLCRNRACCNPDHLEPVTRQTNVDRGARRKGYSANLRRTTAA